VSLFAVIVDVNELQSLQKGFKEVDKDKSGDLDFAEFQALMKKELKTAMTDDSLHVCVQHPTPGNLF